MDRHCWPRPRRRVDELVAQAQRRGRVPALVFGVVRDGAAYVPHRRAPGTDADLQFRIGSITKTLTAVLVLPLRDEGQLALDDLLYRHLPGTPVGGVTLRQLLGHVGGLQREPDGDWWERTAGGDVDTLLAELTPDKVAYPAAARLPLLQPRVRAARRRPRPGHRQSTGRRWSGSGSSTRSA